MKTRAFFAGLLMCALVVGPAHAENSHRVQPSPSHIYVIGDSITYRGTHAMHRLRPTWSVTGNRGMRVAMAPAMVRELLRVDPHPRIVVLALGTNASVGWTARHWRATIRLLPPRTRVVLVTTYRGPNYAHNPHWVYRSHVQAYYSRLMHGIARADRRVCIADWRGVAQRHPSMLIDGVHPTPSATFGWANLVRRAAQGVCAK